MKAKEAAEQAVNTMRQLMAQCLGEDEKTTLRAFIDAVGSEVDGLEMRLDEIEEEERLDDERGMQ